MPLDLTMHYTFDELAEYIHRPRETAADRIKRGLLPAHSHKRGNSKFFSVSEVAAVFRTLNADAAVVVSVDENLGNKEFRKFGVYACPSEAGHHVGIERPSLLGLYSKSHITFYEVTAVETLGNTPHGTRPAGKVARKIQTRRHKNGMDADNLAIFFLDKQIGSMNVGHSVQGSRFVPASWVRSTLLAAIDEPVTLPTIR
jgi:hypothetical protein